MSVTVDSPCLWSYQNGWYCAMHGALAGCKRPLEATK